MSKNIIIFTVLAALSGIALFLLTPKVNYAKEDTIILGTMSGWPPYVSLNNDGEYQGLDIDIAKEIAKRLNKKLIIKDMDTVMLMTALSQGKIDFAMTGLCITHDRLQKIMMVPYQGETITELPLLFWNNIPAGITSLEDIKKIPSAIICVEAGSAQEDFIKQQDLEQAGIIIKESNPTEALLDLKYGKALACLLEPSIFANFKSKYPNLKAINIPLDKKNQIVGNGIGIKKDNKQLISKIESIIQKLKNSGFIDECQNKWISKGN